MIFIMPLYLKMLPSPTLTNPHHYPHHLKPRCTGRFRALSEGVRVKIKKNFFDFLGVLVQGYAYALRLLIILVIAILMTTKMIMSQHTMVVMPKCGIIIPFTAIKRICMPRIQSNA